MDVGEDDGLLVGDTDGVAEGEALGLEEGVAVGALDGEEVGELEGDALGEAEGAIEIVGLNDGALEGLHSAKGGIDGQKVRLEIKNNVVHKKMNRI